MITWISYVEDAVTLLLLSSRYHIT